MGVEVGVDVNRSGLGVDSMMTSGRVIFLTPLPVPAVFLVSGAVFVVVFVLVGVFIPFCVPRIELPLEIPFPTTARVIPMAWIPSCTPAFVVVCAPAFVVSPMFAALPGFIPICGAPVELPLEPVSLGAAVVMVMV
jgi:hypothetical protein